jgi:hypothetical protein
MSLSLSHWQRGKGVTHVVSEYGGCILHINEVHMHRMHKLTNVQILKSSRKCTEMTSPLYPKLFSSMTLLPWDCLSPLVPFLPLCPSLYIVISALSLVCSWLLTAGCACLCCVTNSPTQPASQTLLGSVTCLACYLLGSVTGLADWLVAGWSRTSSSQVWWLAICWRRDSFHWATRLSSSKLAWTPSHVAAAGVSGTAGASATAYKHMCVSAWLHKVWWLHCEPSFLSVSV